MEEKIRTYGKVNRLTAEDAKECKGKMQRMRTKGYTL